MRMITACFAHALQRCRSRVLAHFILIIQGVRKIDKTCNQLNIKENSRNRKTPKRGRKRLFNAAIHALRERVERTFAWEDKCKRLLLRFEYIQQRHYGMKLMAYTLINLRRFCSA
jgi:hypothetical protein